MAVGGRGPRWGDGGAKDPAFRLCLWVAIGRPRRYIYVPFAFYPVDLVFALKTQLEGGPHHILTVIALTRVINDLGVFFDSPRSMSVPAFALPDIHERWPFPVAYNRWEDVVSGESLAWIESLSILSGPDMKKFRAMNFDRFASMAYAYFTDVHHFRVACDIVNLLFVLDDITDQLSAAEVRCIAAISLAAIRCGISIISLVIPH